MDFLGPAALILLSPRQTIFSPAHCRFEGIAFSAAGEESRKSGTKPTNGR